jgi:hypothetical protein
VEHESGADLALSPIGPRAGSVPVVRVNPNESRNTMNKPVRLGFSLMALGSVALLSGACSKTDAASTQPGATSVAVQATSPSNSEVIPTNGSLVKDTPTTDKKSTTPGKQTTTTVKATGPEFATAAAAAFQAKLGDFKAIQVTIHTDNGNAEAQVQDPAKPANVDAYDYKGGAVSGPVPVKLTGSGELADNLFAASEIAWDKLPAMMDQAKTEIPPTEGSTGVTHIIIQKNLPFDNDTVVNVYVGSGTRGGGGYVSFKGDGTLKKVQASK